MTQTTDPAVAEAVGAAMKAAGLSEVELSDASFIPRSTLRRRLAGVSSFTVAELRSIASALDVSLMSLLGEAA